MTCFPRAAEKHPPSRLGVSFLPTQSRPAQTERLVHCITTKLLYAVTYYMVL